MYILHPDTTGNSSQLIESNLIWKSTDNCAILEIKIIVGKCQMNILV